MSNKPIIGISIGDINGIGIETIIKVFSDNRMLDICTPVIFSGIKVINYYRRNLADHPFNFHIVKHMNQIKEKQCNVFNCWDEDVNIQPGELNETGGKYAIRSLMVATQCLKDEEIDAIVTCPIHKNNTQQSDFKYTGHTPYFKEKFEAKDVVMMLYNQEFKIALATEHVPIAEVAKHITQPLLTQKIQILKNSLIQDFGIDKPKIAVLGLNPHAGDGGLIGQEEETIISPTIKLMQDKEDLIFGPYSADAFFARSYQYQFDATFAMYHDQGLIPLKSIGNSEGVNYTCGLPIVRTSPDHGTAFNIAGKNQADPSSLREAIFQAIDILQTRKNYQESTQNPLQKQTLHKERH